ncbi:MAG: MerR family transcriptional regulator [Propionibacteriaceae bacterium]|nr:MerR family transcriptional regulator [Propionibacteriaceae bacterium]
MPPGTKPIGQVLKILKEDFPDITVSKIRFLEAEGLVSPERAPSGYRRYSADDIERLRYVLDVQKNQYLPLKVIRENLDAMDAGEDAPAQPTASNPAARAAPPVAPVPVQPLAEALASPRAVPGKRPLHLTRKELLQLSGLTEAVLSQLEEHRLIVPRRGTIHYGRDALTVAVVARKLAAYGMDARHLRAIKQVAEREAALVDQAVQSNARRRTPSRKASAEVMQLVLYAHAALLRTSIRS